MPSASPSCCFSLRLSLGRSQTATGARWGCLEETRSQVVQRSPERQVPAPFMPPGFLLRAGHCRWKAGTTLPAGAFQIQRGLASPTFPSLPHTAPSSLGLVLHFLDSFNLCVFIQSHHRRKSGSQLRATVAANPLAAGGLIGAGNGRHQVIKIHMIKVLPGMNEVL